MKTILILTALVALSACSGGDRFSSGSSAAATAPVSRACLAADRSAASPALCGCVQRVANAELSRADRARLVRFFEDPEFAHSIRISDTTANDDFWRRYQDFVGSARDQCS